MISCKTTTIEKLTGNFLAGLTPREMSDCDLGEGEQEAFKIVLILSSYIPLTDINRAATVSSASLATLHFTLISTSLSESIKLLKQLFSRGEFGSHCVK